MNISVEPHQMVTRRVAPEDFLNSRMSSRTCLASSILFLPFFTLGAVDLLYIVAVEDGFARLYGLQERLDLLEQVAIEDAGLISGGVHIVFEDVPACEDQVVEASERHKL